MAELTDDMIDAALKRGEEERAKAPAARSARYHRAEGRVVVEFENGASFSVPVRLLQDLEDASDEDLADVDVERGHALRWPRLDVDFTIAGLMAGVFGTAAYMAAHAGRATSVAKAAAARENGRKGGRPRQVLASAGGET